MSLFLGPETHTPTHIYAHTRHNIIYFYVCLSVCPSVRLSVSVRPSICLFPFVFCLASLHLDTLRMSLLILMFFTLLASSPSPCLCPGVFITSSCLRMNEGLPREGKEAQGRGGRGGGGETGEGIEEAVWFRLRAKGWCQGGSRRLTC